MQAHQHKSLTYALWKQGHCTQRPYSASAAAAAAVAATVHTSVLLPRAHSEYNLSLDDSAIIELRQDAALLARCASSVLKLGVEAKSLLLQDSSVQQQHIFAGTIRQATSGRGLSAGAFYSPNSSIADIAAIKTQPRAAGNRNKAVQAQPVHPDRASAKRHRSAAYRRGTCPGLLQGHTRRSAAAAVVKQAAVPAVTVQRRSSLAAAATTDRRKGSLPATWSSADQFTLLSELKTFFAPQYSLLQRRQQVLARAVAANSSSSTDGAQQHNDSAGGANGEQLLTTAEASAQYIAALSDAALLARESLKFDPSVLAALNEFWRLVKKHIIVRNNATSSSAAATASTQIGLSRDDYIALSMRMQKVVTAPELFTQKRARAVAVAEWQHDSNGHSYLDRNRFCNALFQAAAMWATADTPQQYSAFLWTLLDALSFRERNGSRRWRWEPRAQYTSADADKNNDDCDSNGDVDKTKRSKQRHHRTAAAVAGVAHKGVAHTAAAVSSDAVYNKSSSADPLLWSSRKRLTVPRQPPITRTRRVHPMLRCMHKREQCYTGIDAVACDHTARCDLQYRVLTDAQQCTAERIGDTTVIQPVLRIEARVRPHSSPVCTQQLHALYTNSSGSIAAMRASQGIHSSSSDECCGLLPVSPRDAHILQQLLV
jgi:hypothetical protein